MSAGDTGLRSLGFRVRLTAGAPTTEDESWRPAIGWPAYEVSDRGRVRRAIPGRGTRAGHVLAHVLIGRPWAKYPAVKLSRPGRCGFVTVHSLVARAFLGEPPAGHEIDYVNRDKNDPRLANLEYVTRGENRRRRGNGTCKRCSGPHSYCGARAERARPLPSPAVAR